MFCLNRKGSVLSCDVFPPHDLSDGSYVIGLVDLSTFNSIPNIEHDKNDKFYYGNQIISFEEGSYEIENIENYIKTQLVNGVKLSLKANNNTLKSEIQCSEIIHFDKEGTIVPMLGFSEISLPPNTKHISDLPVDIIKVNTICVECNIVRGTFDNGREGHVLHEFYPLVPPGYKIVEIPNTIVYLPVNVQRIHNITVVLRDQNGQPINLRNETVSLRLHVKKADGFSI